MVPAGLKKMKESYAKSTERGRWSVHFDRNVRGDLKSSKNISMSVAARAAVFQDRVCSQLPEYENDSKVPGTKLCPDRF